MRFILTIFFFLGFAAVYGQRVTVSAPIELGHNTTYRLLGKVGKYNAVFVDRENRYELYVYDNELNKLWDRTLDEVPPDIRISGLLTKNGNIHLFYMHRSKDTSFLIHRIYNLQAESLDSTVIVKTVGRFDSPYFFTYSQDKSKILFFNPAQKKSLNVITYDLDLQKILWKNSFLFEKRVNNEFELIEISDAGEVFVVLDKENSVFKNKQHKIVVYRCSGTHQIIKQTINFEGKLTYSLNGKYDNINEVLMIGGYYSEDKSILAQGVFLFQFYRNNTTTFFDKFNSKILHDIEGYKQRNINGLSNLIATDILLTENGGAVILGEIRKKYQFRRSYSSFSIGLNSSIDFYYEDILVYAISAENKHIWTRVIHKRQYSQDDFAIFSSFFIFKVPSFLELIFNDRISSNSTVSAFGINGAGEINRSNLMSTGFQDLKIRFNRAIQTSSKSFIAPSDYKGKLKLVLVEF